MAPEAQAVVDEISRRAWIFGVAVLLSPEETVPLDGGLRSSGWFDGEKKILAVATGREERWWLGTLCHEYSHLTQWAENAPVWLADEKSPDWWDWLSGKQVRNYRKGIETSREIEADCERRTVRLMRELSVPVDIEKYCRCANSYVHFYNLIPEVRKWYRPERAPYYAEDVTSLFNSTLDADYSKTPKHLLDALRTCV